MRIVPTKKLIFWAGLMLPFTLFISLYPMIRPATLMYLLFLAGLALADLLISYSLPGKIRVILPEKITLIQNRPKDLEIGIKNIHHRPLQARIAFDLISEIVIDPEQIIASLEGQGEGPYWLNIEGKQRGMREVKSLNIEVSSYLGLWLIRERRSYIVLIAIYPNIFQDNQRLAASLLLRSEFGIRPQRLIGHGREFEQLRDYLPDDNYSDIAWKTTAKKGKPITKVFQGERTQQVYVVLDYSRSSHFSYDTRPNLDIAIESTLLLQLCCEKEGDLLGLITFADKVTGFCPAGKGKTLFGVLRNMVYDLRPKLVTPDFEQLFIFIKQHLNKRALILLFTNLEDPGLASIFFKDLVIINRIHLVTLCTFDAYAHTLLFGQEIDNGLISVYERLAAQLANNEQERLASRLKKQNVDMLRFRPEMFAMGVIDHYLRVKRRQLL